MNTSKLLQALINARGPSGQEDEVLNLCQEVINPFVDEMWVDPAGNLIGKVNGTGDLAPIRLMVHMDEISMIVKKINPDGSLRVDPLGGLLPGSLGQTPVEILADKQILRGILSFGALHISKETPSTHKFLPEEDKGLEKALAWSDVKIITRLSPEELKSMGVRPGTRVVVAQSRRELFYFQDCIAGYFLDNRAAIVIGIEVLRQMRETNQRPKSDLYFVATCSEEIGGPAGSYACRNLPGDLTIALDVGPVAEEYQVELSSAPIVVYQDTFSLYDKKVSDTFIALGNKMNLPLQCAIWNNYGSDSSLAHIRGQTAKSALICFPCANTHGYEIIHQESMEQLSKLLFEFLVKE